MRGGYCGLDEKNIVALEKFNTLSNIHKYKYKKVTFKLREDEHKKKCFFSGPLRGAAKKMAGTLRP